MKADSLEKKKRAAASRRATKETTVELELAVDGSGKSDVETGIGFLDHMLELLTHHGQLDLTVRAQGDLHVDFHHTVEDVGLVLGDCLGEALGDKAGVNRFGLAYVPLDEALSRVVVDLSGRPYLSWRVRFTSDRVGDFPTELFQDFFRALSDRARLTLHVETLHGENNHHIIETVFKAFARSLRQACRRTGGAAVPSTKGTLKD
jgi:imidazoleglycerol-phosphate dehydratase